MGMAHPAIDSLLSDVITNEISAIDVKGFFTATPSFKQISWLMKI
jgi:hypothetical protein